MFWREVTLSRHHVCDILEKAYSKQDKQNIVMDCSRSQTIPSLLPHPAAPPAPKIYSSTRWKSHCRRVEVGTPGWHGKTQWIKHFETKTERTKINVWQVYQHSDHNVWLVYRTYTLNVWQVYQEQGFPTRRKSFFCDSQFS